MNVQEIKHLIASMSGIMLRTLRLMVLRGKKDLNVQVKFSGGAYTDGKKIVIGLPEFYFEDDKKGYALITKILGREPTMNDASMTIKGLGYHEDGHVNFSNFKEMKIWRDWWTNEFKVLWDGKSEIHKNLVEKCGATWNNAIEDGRIEAFMVNSFPGTAKYLKFNNLIMWSIHSEKKNKSDWVNFYLSACFYATTGIFPKWFADVDNDMHKAMETIMPDIDDIVKTASTSAARKKTQKMILKIKDYIIQLLEKEMAQADLMEAIQKFLQQFIDEFEGAEGEAAEDQEDLGDDSISIRISMPGAGKSQNKKGDQKAKGSGSGDSSDSDKKDEDDKDGNGSGDKSKDKDSDEKNEEDGSGSGDSKDEKSDKESKKGSGKDKDSDKDSKSEQNKNKNSIDNERKAPDHAERDGEEGGDDDESQPNNNNNNGQGTNSQGNKAPDSSDETISETDENLEDAVKQQLDRISAESKDDFSQSAKREAEAEKKESGENSSLNQNEVNEIRAKYDKTQRSVEGFKEVDVTAKAKPDAQIVNEGRRFRKEIEKILKSQVDTVIRGTTRGKVSTSQLYRLNRKDFSIFEVKSIPNKTNAAVYILWDDSGSMCGEKQRLSTIACAIIEEGLKGLIPLRITAFATEYMMVKHWKIKDFDQNAKDHNYAWSHGTAKGFNGGNKDGYSIRIATSEILKRPEKTKLLIVLSDGLPSDYPGTDIGMGDVKDAVKDARKKGVEVISVMFGESGFRSNEFKNYKEMYETGIVSADPERLTTELIKQIRKVIFNKGR